MNEYLNLWYILSRHQDRKTRYYDALWDWWRVVWLFLSCGLLLVSSSPSDYKWSGSSVHKPHHHDKVADHGGPAQSKRTKLLALYFVIILSCVCFWQQITIITYTVFVIVVSCVCFWQHSMCRLVSVFAEIAQSVIVPLPVIHSSSTISTSLRMSEATKHDWDTVTQVTQLYRLVLTTSYTTVPTGTHYKLHNSTDWYSLQVTQQYRLVLTTNKFCNILPFCLMQRRGNRGVKWPPGNVPGRSNMVFWPTDFFLEGNIFWYTPCRRCD